MPTISPIRRKLEENKVIFTLFIIMAGIAGKIIEEFLLPPQYFFDSNRINSTVVDINFKDRWYSGSYKVAVDFFRKINVFHFTERVQWSIFLGIVMTIVLIIMFTRCSGMDNTQIFFATMCVGLCNIYIFNICKDVIQFMIFIVIYIVVSINKLPIWVKAILAALLLRWESEVYKSYYIIMAFFFIVIFIAFSIIRRKRKRLTKLQYLIVVVGLFAMVYVFLFAARSIYPKDYNDIMEARNYSNQQGQNSAIQEVYEHNGNLNIFFVDYLIDSVRMMFPFELVQMGVFYLPFFLFQVFMLLYLVRGVKNMDELDDKSFIGLCIFLAYFLGSVLFEPDFGSFVRHEAATLPIISLMVFNESMWSPRLKEQIRRDEFQSEELPADF